MKYIVKITQKTTNDGLLKQVITLGYKDIDKICFNKLYKFQGDIDKNEVFNIAKILLVDPIIEDFEVLPKFNKDKNQTIVNIWYQPQVLDVVALYVKKGIRYLGIKKDLEVYTGTQLCITSKYDRNRTIHLVEKFFMNPLIQYYEII